MSRPFEIEILNCHFTHEIYSHAAPGTSDTGTEHDSPPKEHLRLDISQFSELKWTCDGPCGTLYGRYRELYICCVCKSVCFCESCINFIKPTCRVFHPAEATNSGAVEEASPAWTCSRMPYRKCSLDHSWVQVYPLSAIPKDIVDRAVTFGNGYAEFRREWWEGLREKWRKRASPVPSCRN